jgi:hypothetical protein
MNARSLVLILAVGLIGIGLVMTILDFLKGPPAVPQVIVARAAQQIEPGTVIGMEMLASEQMRARDAEGQNAWKLEQVAGMMSTRLISPGTLLSAANVQPVEQARGDADLNNELVSFAASLDRMVAGRLKPGQYINIYGTSTGKPEDTYTVLIEPNVRVVSAVQSSGGDVGATPVADWETGLVRNEGDQRTATLLTVSLPPDKAYNLINALGARGLSPWVTIAANTSVQPMATPVVDVGQLPDFPDIAATMTAIALTVAPTTQPQGPVTGGGGASR